MSVQTRVQKSRQLHIRIRAIRSRQQEQQTDIAPSGEAAFQLALKEWSVTCAALGAGEQTVSWSSCLTILLSCFHSQNLLQESTVVLTLLQILLRKGGIAEKGFQAAAQHLLLMPTSFHVDAAVLLPAAAAAYRQARAPLLLT